MVIETNKMPINMTVLGTRKNPEPLQKQFYESGNMTLTEASTADFSI
jgi:hypothetical protein